MTGIAVRVHGTSFVASFHLDGALYFLWLREDGKTLDGGTLHKQTPRAGHAALFTSAYCSPTAKANVPLVARLFETIERDGLIARARAEHAAKEAREAEQQRLTDISWAKSQAGDELYEVVRIVAKGLKSGAIKDQTLILTAAPDAAEAPVTTLSAMVDAALAKADTLPAREA
jgi:hypothetical protein